MPFLFLTEQEVRQVLTMEMALEAVESALRKLGLDEAQNIPRSRCQTDHVVLHVMSAAAKTLGIAGYKAYTTSKKEATFHVGLFDGKTGELNAIIQADYLGQVRTGATSGVATKYLARPESATVGLYGTGKQARTQLLAVCQVRPIKHVAVYSRSEENRRQFCAEMTPLCKCPVEPAMRPEDSARGKDIVITATTAREPVLFGDWLTDGAHLNIIGSNYISKSEIDVAVVRRASQIFVDNKDQAHVEAGDFHQARDAGVLNWGRLRELGELVAGRAPGRQGSTDITLFKSLGLAIEDIATAAKVVAQAKELKIGRWIEW